MVATSKAKLRKEILNIRTSMKQGAVIDFSSEICSKIIAHKYYERAKNICIYMPIRNEVDLTGLLNADNAVGKNFYIPKVFGSYMEFLQLDYKTSLAVSSFGILEPTDGDFLVPDENTLIIMPGAVFSEKCQRIGYGGGYYDKYLERYSSCMTIAVAYDFQIIESFSTKEYDVKPDYIISERRMIKKEC